MNYIDGYVIAVPTANREAYRAKAEKMAVLFKKHGALNVIENWGNDVPEGKFVHHGREARRKRIHRLLMGHLAFKNCTRRSLETRDARTRDARHQRA
jgi:uncharacterized protein YbaA (DUF1428 family)